MGFFGVLIILKPQLVNILKTRKTQNTYGGSSLCTPESFWLQPGKYVLTYRQYKSLSWFF